MLERVVHGKAAGLLPMESSVCFSILRVLFSLCVASIYRRYEGFGHYALLHFALGGRCRAWL